MNKRNAVLLLATMVFALGLACAQDDSQSTEASAPQRLAAAYGQDNGTSTPIYENPPLSSLDLPSLQENAAPLSYLQPGATFSQSATTNIGNTLAGGNSWGSITRGLGTLELRRLWSHYDLGLDYVGGGAYYNQSGIGWRQLQDLGVIQKIEWKRGQLSLRDSFSYLPEGSFGAPYGSIGSTTVTGIGGSSFSSFWNSGLGSFGLAPRIMNVSLAELSQNLTSKSSLTATGGYAFTHFYGSDLSGASFIGSSQVSAQAGYNRILNSRSQVAVSYGYQGFDFSVADVTFHTHVAQGMYGYRISGRMDLMLSAGPQVTFINTPTEVCTDPTVPALFCVFAGKQLVPETLRNTKLGVAAQARLRYQISKSSLNLGYERFQTSGGGLFAGSQIDVIHFAIQHPLSRVWSLTTDAGFSRNDRLQPLTSQQISGCNGFQGSQNACPANDATTYREGYAGAVLHRHFSRQFHAFLSYQFNELSFDHSYCLSGAACNRISNRNIATFGLDWTPRPIRID